jgi:uncharacterized OB-fold protein
MTMSEIETFINMADTSGEQDYIVCHECGTYNHPRRFKCTCGRKTNTMYMTVADFEWAWAESHTAHQ